MVVLVLLYQPRVAQCFFVAEYSHAGYISIIDTRPVVVLASTCKCVYYVISEEFITYLFHPLTVCWFQFHTAFFSIFAAL